jgi:hypothetical protein
MNDIKKYMMWVIVALFLGGCGGSGGGTAADPQQSAVDKISAYADNGRNVPDVKDYLDAGITGVTEENIERVNAAVEEAEKAEADSPEEIQRIIDACIAICHSEKTAPVITILGDNPASVEINATYTDAGATAWDKEDGDIPIQRSGNVDTSAEGVYRINYIAVDRAGNKTVVSRTVYVIDASRTYPPIANIEKLKPCREGDIVRLNGSASADIDGEIVKYEWFSDHRKIGEGVKLDINATEIGVGNHAITLRVTDDDGNQDTDTVTARVYIGIKKTGQIKSYNEDGEEIDDGSIRDDGFYQKGVTPLYSRDESNGTVTDHITGLMWQDNTEVYRSWLNEENYLICREDSQSSACKDTSGDTAMTYCDDLNLSGYSDWRLPNIRELQSIVDYHMEKPALPYIFRYRRAGYFWSSNSVVGHESYGWMVSFEYGDANGYLKNGQLFIRCVRDGGGR